MQKINVIGGGLAGCEAALAAARGGSEVVLWEMRPVVRTPVHRTPYLAELVCSNSLKSEREDTAQGVLKKEMRMLGSQLLPCADSTRVPAGAALAVDRNEFASLVSEKVENEKRITVVREEVTCLPEGICIIATGPLTSGSFSVYLQELTGGDNLYFYDAVAPSVTLDSIDREIVFKASRYNKGSADYYNCPLNREQYEIFCQQLVNADVKAGHSIDKRDFFDGCMPIEVMARRGKDTLRFGPMRPVGLENPRGGERPYAVLQLRQEDREGSVYGLVGFQTRLTWGEQDRILRLLPGLKKAEFIRYGVMHRNTYVNSPRVLGPTLQLNEHPQVLMAGQITGVEGYMESAATGILAGINAARINKGIGPLVLDHHTLLGALIRFITTADADNFQPINANFGVLPPLETRIRDKKARTTALGERALLKMGEFSELLVKTL